MKKHWLIFLILIPSILGIAGFGILIANKNPEQKVQTTQVLGVSSKSNINSAVTKKSLSDLDALVQIPNEKEAIVVEITDQKKIREFDPLFGRSYKGDLIVFLPDQTIVFDPVTKTVRDIISKSFYKEVKK